MSLSHSSFAGSQKSTGLIDHKLLIHCSAKNFLTIQQVSRITAFFIRIYKRGQRLSGFKLSGNFQVTCLEQCPMWSTNGIIQAILVVLVIKNTFFNNNLIRYTGASVMGNSLQIASTGLLGPLKTQEYSKKNEECSAISGCPGQWHYCIQACTEHDTKQILYLQCTTF